MTEAEQLEFEIMQKTQALAELRRKEAGTEVTDYAFKTINGPTSLSALFGDQERLLMIHNMGQACRYCTLWADGINGILDHLEDAMAVVLVSKDTPDVQRKMALNRGWRMRTASHGGGAYMSEQCIMGDHANMPGAAVYEKNAGKIMRNGRTAFGPGDLYSPMWHFLALAGVGTGDWTPQYHYWHRPKQLEDGAENIRD